MKKFNYTKTEWVDGKTVVDAKRLNNIERGVSELYDNAIALSDLEEGDGIEIDNGRISVSEDVIRSQSISGIEFSVGVPEEVDPKKLYLILKADRTLEKIILGGITIFEN